MNSFQNIPKELQNTPRWCVWKRLENQKIPYEVLGGDFWLDTQRCKSDTPSEWVSFENALNCFLKDKEHLGGLSFALGDGWCGVDFDDVIIDGQTHPQAEIWLSQLDGYSEISQSGKGIKTILRGQLSKAFLGSATTGRQFKNIPFKNMMTEVYHCGRFFFLTGNGSGEPKENQVGLNAFCDELLSLKEVMNPKPPRPKRRIRTFSDKVDTKALDAIDHNALSYDE